MSDVAKVPVKDTRLILVTMVKNESRILRRLLDSVKSFVDAMVICDTGSTDNTREIATEYLAQNSMPGRVVQYPFETFGKSRTKSFQAAQEWLKEQDAAYWKPECCWALLLDGDMVLRSSPDRVALAVQGPHIAGVSLKQGQGNLIYSNMRLLRCSEPWICKGSTHEAWTCPPGRTTAGFDTPVIDDISDGGCKSDKFERDARLLMMDLSENPQDARTHFYLGQTYLCMGRHADALPWFRKRIDLGGWDEEVYVTYQYIGDCANSLGKKEEAVGAWLDGWQHRQHRSECPMRLVSHFRKLPKSQFIGMMFLEKFFSQQFGEMLDGTPAPKVQENRDVLFVSKRELEFSIWEELAILAYYNEPYRRPAWARLQEFDLTNHLPWHDYNSVLGHLRWYDWVFPRARTTRIELPLDQMPWGKDEDATIWQPTNPSFRLTPDGKSYWFKWRYVNYYTNDAKFYGYRGRHGEVLTRNIMCEYPAGESVDWNAPTKLEELVLDPKYIKSHDTPIKGMEDCRWIQGSPRREFLATTKNYTASPTNKIQHVKEEDDGEWSVKEMPLPPGTNPGDCQKNWSPFTHKGEQLYVFTPSPFQICRMDGSFKLRWEPPKRFSFDGLRGSSSPVKWRSKEFPRERYLLIVHKVQVGDRGRRYYHRWMTLDDDLKPSRISCFFRMTNEDIEYVSGLCPTVEGDRMLVGYGVKDCEAYLAEVPIASIETSLVYDLQAEEDGAFKKRYAKMVSLMG